jgi:hypothetical protein
VALDRIRPGLSSLRLLPLLQSMTDSSRLLLRSTSWLIRIEPCDTLRWQTTFRGFGPFSVLRTTWSLESLALPTATRPCILRVSHPHDALLPKLISGPISFRFRSWDFPLQGFLPVKTRPLLSERLTLIAFGMTPFVVMLCLQGFVHPHGCARLAKLFTRCAAHTFLGFGSSEASCLVSLAGSATFRR